MKRCLYCYQPITETETDFHPTCSKKIFGSVISPTLPYTREHMLELASKVIKSHTTVTGVQPKLSLGIEKSTEKHAVERLTIIGVNGNYILKPATANYSALPELEDLTMHLATLSKITVVPHSLVRLQSGELAYITGRIDREKKSKIHMEDMCQLTERLTEHKYQGSYEQIAKKITQYSANPGFDIIAFFEVLIFSFLTGNADMHLKNFSIWHHPKLGPSLTPAYDLVPSALLVPDDMEELALTLNAKKRKIRREDFDQVMSQFKIPPKAQERIWEKFTRVIPEWRKFIEISFIKKDLQDAYWTLILERASRINLT